MRAHTFMTPLRTALSVLALGACSPFSAAPGGGEVDAAAPPGPEASVPPAPSPTDGSAEVPSEAGPCGAYETDGANCGRPGHSCLGGRCAACACQPVVIHTDLVTAPTGIAIEGANAYIGFSDGHIIKKPKSSFGSATSVLAPQPRPVGAMTTVASLVLFTEAAAMGRIRRIETAANEVISDVTPDLAAPGGVAGEGTNSFAAEVIMGRLFRKDGASPGVYIAMGLQKPGGIAVIGSRVLVAQEDAGKITAYLYDGMVDTDYQQNIDKPGAMTSFGNDLYYATNSVPYGIFRKTSRAAAPERIASPASAPADIAADGTAVYWTDTVARTASMLALP